MPDGAYTQLNNSAVNSLSIPPAASPSDAGGKQKLDNGLVYNNRSTSENPLPALPGRGGVSIVNGADRCRQGVNASLSSVTPAHQSSAAAPGIDVLADERSDAAGQEAVFAGQESGDPPPLVNTSQQSSAAAGYDGSVQQSSAASACYDGSVQQSSAAAASYNAFAPENTDSASDYGDFVSENTGFVWSESGSFVPPPDSQAFGSGIIDALNHLVDAVKGLSVNSASDVRDTLSADRIKALVKDAIDRHSRSEKAELEKWLGYKADADISFYNAIGGNVASIIDDLKQKLGNQGSQLNSKIEFQEKRIDGIKTQNAELKQKLDEFADVGRSIPQLDTRIKQLSDQNTKLQAAADRSIPQLDTRIKQLADQNVQLKQKLDEFAAAGRVISQQNSRIEQLAAQNAQLKRKLDEFAAAGRVISQQNSRIEQLAAQNAQLKQNLDEFAAAANGNASLRNDVQLVSQQVADLQNKAANLQNKLQEVKDQARRDSQRLNEDTVSKLSSMVRRIMLDNPLLYDEKTEKLLEALAQAEPGNGKAADCSLEDAVNFGYLFSSLTKSLANRGINALDDKLETQNMINGYFAQLQNRADDSEALVSLLREHIRYSLVPNIAQDLRKHIMEVFYLIFVRVRQNLELNDTVNILLSPKAISILQRFGCVIIYPEEGELFDKEIMQAVSFESSTSNTVSSCDVPGIAWRLADGSLEVYAKAQVTC